MKKRTLKDHYNIVSVNVMFVLLGGLFLTLGAYLQSLSFDMGILFTEYIIVLLPVFILGAIQKVNIKKALRFNPMPIKVIIKIFFMSLFLVPIIGFGNIVVSTILNYFDLIIMYEIPSATNSVEFIKYSFLIAFSAGLCEEVFFRGMVLDAFENHFNKKTAMFMSAFLFGVFHYNIQNLVGPMLIGLIFAYIVYITNSIYAAIIAHAVNNWVSVVAGYVVNIVSTEIPDVTPAEASLTPGDMLAGTIIMGIVAMISIIIILLFIRSIKKDCLYFEDNELVSVEDEKYHVVKVKSKGLILLPTVINPRGMTLDSFYSSLRYITFDRMKKEKLSVKRILFNQEQLKVISTKNYPLMISMVMYVFFMVTIWKSYGLL